MILVVGITWYVQALLARKIPPSWLSYENTYYGYSLRYDPELVVEPDIYGTQEGQDLGITIHKLDPKKLKAHRMESRDQFLRAFDFHRGVLLGPDYDQWNISIKKPVVITNELRASLSKNCKREKTNINSPYYNCREKNSNWELAMQTSSTIDSGEQFVVSIGTSQPYNAFSRDEKIMIQRIAYSFFTTKSLATTGPSKNDLLQWIKVNWCDNSITMFDSCENGLKQYQKYSVLSVKKSLGDIYLAKPKSFCDIPENSVPLLSPDACTFVDNSRLYDIHALGNCEQYPVCGRALPTSSYENSQDGITSALQDVVKHIPLPSHWKYSIMAPGQIMVASPENWIVQQNPTSSAESASLWMHYPSLNEKPPFMLIIINEFMKSIPRDEIVDNTSFLELGTIYCGKYAECTLARKTLENPSEFEYYLLLTDHPNFISRPKKITLKFFTNDQYDKMLREADSVVKTMIFLNQEQVE